MIIVSGRPYSIINVSEGLPEFLFLAESPSSSYYVRT